MTILRSLCLALALAPGLGVLAAAPAQSGPLRIEITEGVIEPLPFAVPRFIAETAGAARARGRDHRGWWSPT